MEVQNNDINHITPIVHMTNECNLACRYCYVGSALKPPPNLKRINEKFRSSIDTLFDGIDQVMSYNNNKPTRIIFHGGEPLLINPSNWALIFNYVQEKNYMVKFGVQTNGLLLNDHFINLFKQFDMEIGISLDGPGILNDRTRILKSGKETFSLVYRKMLKLKKAGLKFGVLLTLNNANIHGLEDIYNFFKKENISFTVRPIFQTKHTNQKGLPIIKPHEYAGFVCKLFDKWFDDENANTFLIEEFASMIAQLINPIEGLVSCNFTKSCSEHFISFDLDGNVFPCNRFYGDTNFLYGNIRVEGLKALLSKPLPKSLTNRWTQLSKDSCMNCEIAEYCYGGCPANSYYYNGNYFTKDYYCKAYKIIWKHVYERVKSTLKE